MSFRKSRMLMWIAFGAGLLLLAMAAGLSFGPLVAAGAIVILAGMIQAAVFYRCPHCGASLLDVRGAIPEYCPRCGGRLD